MMLSIQQLERAWIVALIFLFVLIVGIGGYVAYGGTLTKNPDMTYTFAPSPDETMVIEQAEKQYGQEVVKDLIENWIQDRKRVFAEQEKDELKKDLDELTETDRQKILDMLKGRRMIR